MLAPAAAAEHAPEVVSAYVLNVARFVSWPDTTFATDPKLRLCYYGRRSDLGSALAKLDGQNVNGRSVQVLSTTRADRLAACHVVVVPQTTDLDPVTPASAPYAVVISEDDKGDASPAIVLTRDERGLRFRLDLDALRERGLRISANVIRLALSVKGRQ
ncbi:YfiR family protein [Amphibiibacter pelophylacis]|uniref:YfiR family protein n=1 Tax=Amphibiibacter pelophylacis TaxID=1799477 RepID=A0ACC6P591_9BURK